MYDYDHSEDNKGEDKDDIDDEKDEEKDGSEDDDDDDDDSEDDKHEDKDDKDDSREDSRCHCSTCSPVDSSAASICYDESDYSLPKVYVNTEDYEECDDDIDLDDEENQEY